jgi:hypothetical protein
MSTEEKSLGRKILSFFIQEESSGTPTKPVENVPVSRVENTPIAERKADTTVGTDKKFVDHFVQLIEKSNLKGPDYFEFMQTMKSLAGLGLSEEKQFQAAWASFRTMGGVSDITILTSTANEYIGILEQDKTAFLKNADAAIAERVGSLQANLKQMQDDNKAMTEQILALQKKIEVNNEAIKKVSVEIEEQSEKITNNKASYLVTFDFFVEQIKGDIYKIQQHLLGKA